MQYDFKLLSPGYFIIVSPLASHKSGCFIIVSPPRLSQTGVLFYRETPRLSQIGVFYYRESPRLSQIGVRYYRETSHFSQIGVLSTTISDKKQTKIAKLDGTFTKENWAQEMSEDRKRHLQ